MKKYGLQLRVPPQQKKQQPSKAPLPAVFDDEDDDNVEREILRQAYKNKTHKDVEDQHKKALEEDPLAFDYDGVYDTMKEKQVRPVAKDRGDRKPRYIQTIIEKAKQREREHEITYERKLAKERSKDEDLYAGKDKFVTSAYKKKLAEQAKWQEEERLREMREEKDDVTKKTDLSDFYFNLAKNVAFGAEDADSRKPKKQPEVIAAQPSELAAQSPEKISPPATNTSSGPSGPVNLSLEEKSEPADIEPVPDTSIQDQASNEPSASDQPKSDHHKRNVDAVAAAKERFLARKKTRV